MRINKYLATVGVASRRKCEEFVLAGRIEVNGEKVTSLGFQVDEKKDKVMFDGKELSLPSNFLYFKLNKPKGYLCTSSDDRNRKTVLDLIDVSKDVRLFCVGRLDYNTEGLLIITNDGDFAEKLIHPSYDIEKEYHCTIEGEMKESELAVLRAGVVENGKRMPKAKVEVLSVEKNKSGIRTKLSIKINQGQNRQIRRMFEAIGRNIILLKRVAIGDIKLGNLLRGQYKPLSEKEKLCLDYTIF